MTISRATKADLPLILQIQQDAFQLEADQYGDCNIPPLTQTIADLEADLVRKVFLKATESGQVVGSVRAYEQEGVVHVEKLSVAPKCQRHGIGTQLLQAVENAFPHSTQFQLFTGHQSEGNIRLYQKQGYRVIREEKISCRLTLVHMEKQRKFNSVAIA